jgi:hypothetical protein
MFAARGALPGLFAGALLAIACSSKGATGGSGGKGGSLGARGGDGGSAAGGDGGSAGGGLGGAMGGGNGGSGSGTAGGSSGGGGGGNAGGGSGGAGLFGGGATYSFGSAQISSIVTGDLNGDGHPDIAAITWCGASGEPGNLLVLLNQGAGTFAPATSFVAGGTPAALDIGDLNGDGKADVAVANRGGMCGTAPAVDGDVTVLLNTGGGAFGAPTHLAAGPLPLALAIADLNGDGRNDLAVANHGTGTELELRDGGVTVLLGAAGGGFNAPTKYAAGVGPVSVHARDLDGGGRADLVVVNYGYSGIGAPDGTSSLSVLFANAAGGFAAAKSLAAVPGCSDVGFVDFDEDHDVDLLVNNYSGLHTIRNDGGGAFTSATSNFAQILAAGSPAIADFDGDGHADLAVGGYFGAYLIGGNGDGTFRSPAPLPVGDKPAGVLTADFDGDGKPDLAVLNEEGLHVLLNAR